MLLRGGRGLIAARWRNFPLVFPLAPACALSDTTTDCPNGAGCLRSDKPFLVYQKAAETCVDARVTERDSHENRSCANGNSDDKADLPRGMRPPRRPTVG